MANFRIIPFEKKFCEGWNQLIEMSNNGTIFHRLDFLSYHGDRYKKHEHHIVILKGNSLWAVMPMAILEENGQNIAQSPYGGSFGGPVFPEALSYSDATAVVKLLIGYLKGKGIARLFLRLSPQCYEQMHSDTFRFVLMENGFQCTTRDISSVVALDARLEESLLYSHKEKDIIQDYKKAVKLNIRFKINGPLEDFLLPFKKTYARLNIQPTHNQDDLKYLSEKVNKVFFDIAYLDQTPIAGICRFTVQRQTVASFYLCHDEAFKGTQCLSGLIHQSLIYCKAQNMRWYDFGTSTGNMVADENIFQFKENFGAVGQFRENYELRIK